MAKTSATRFDGSGCCAYAIRMARYGRKDWLLWHDATGSHAAVKTVANLKAMIAASPSSWSLVCASDAVLMKGYDWLATNLLAQMETGWS